MKSAVIHLFTFALCIILLRGPGTIAGTISPELESELEGLGSGDEVSVIIHLREKVDVSAFDDHRGHALRSSLIKALKSNSHQTQKSLKGFLNREGVRNTKSLWLINAIAVTAKVPVILKLAEYPDIAEVRLDYTLHMPQTQYALAGEPQWNINKINAPQLWNLGFTGQGIVVANMDSGVDLDHPDLNSRWRGGENSWYDPHGEHNTPYDNDGHGTQTMGIMVGGDAGGTAIGVAPDANWIAAKIFDDSGDANVSDIHLGFQWLLDPDGDPNTDDAPHIVNNSWEIRNHINECLLDFYDDIQLLKTAGIAVVFAAGNSGPSPSSSVSPANYDNSFAVGSVDDSNVVGLTSSRGPSPCYLDFFPQVVAPGQGVKTSDLSFGGLPLYAHVDGTSFAAPHVSGAMALLLNAFPDFSVSQLESTLLLSAVDLGSPGSDYDYGLIDITQAYELANSICPSDFDGNYKVDFSDLAVLIAEWLKTDCTSEIPCQSDLNNDKQVDFDDYCEFASQFGRSTCP
jgi:serine protease AprX